MRERKLRYNYKDTYFKPRGIPLSQLEEVDISKEELEVIRLRYIENLNQINASQSMNISQSQYQRDLRKALRKVVDALINSKAIKIEN